MTTKPNTTFKPEDIFRQPRAGVDPLPKKNSKKISFGNSNTLHFDNHLTQKEKENVHGQPVVNGMKAAADEARDSKVFGQSGMVSGNPPNGHEVAAEIEALKSNGKGWWGGKKTNKKNKKNRKTKRNTRHSIATQNKKSTKYKTVKRRIKH